MIIKSESLFAKPVLFYQSLKDSGGSKAQETIDVVFPNDITVTIKNVHKQIILLTKYKKQLYPSALVEQRVLINNKSMCNIHRTLC